MFEFIAHDKCCKPDEVDRDVRHGQVTQDHDDDVCMYVCEEWGGSHMMKQSAGLVLTTLNGFVIVGLEIVVVL